MTGFLSSTIDALPETSGISDVFQQYLEEIEILSGPTDEVVAKHGSRSRDLTSEFEIESRPGLRPTKISQKLRQEKDRANMSSEDEEYTRLVESLNDDIKEIFTYHPILPELTKKSRSQ